MNLRDLEYILALAGTAHSERAPAQLFLSEACGWAGAWPLQMKSPKAGMTARVAPTAHGYARWAAHEARKDSSYRSIP